MEFAHTMMKGHQGPKKFWSEYLPRLKFHNPSVPMIINRHRQNEKHPVMTIYFRDGPATTTTPGATPEQPTSMVQPPSSFSGLSPAQPAAPDERVAIIDMHDKHSAQILEFFMAETRAAPVEPTPDEVEEIRELEALKKQADFDRTRINRLKAEKKREEDLLRRARALAVGGED
ncbi:hypothetical protein N3K66_002667 [Trichothecium roseum]|uniref:Uncharacterized protein n=1 Tax=Trichothecium roseum TaxID=47278 RepID=A0ACC0VBW3_9HYPO|nr:hypothetical protein N3K66_002667 [Trichothecium roseum]